MTWAKFDDRYDDNRKVKKAYRADPTAVAIHAMAITYSSRHETDGHVDLDWLEEKLPAPKIRERVVKILVDAGLFDAIDGDRFQVHDYLDFNPSSDQLDEKRRKDAERKRLRMARGVLTESTPTPDGIHAESERNPDGVHAESAGQVRHLRTGSALPVPSRPGPSL